MKKMFLAQAEKWNKADWQDKAYGVLLFIGLINVLLYSFIPSLHDSQISSFLIIFFVFTIYVGIIYSAGEILYDASGLEFALKKTFLQMLAAIFSAILLGGFAWVIGYGMFFSLIASFIQELSIEDCLQMGRITSLVITIGGVILTILVKSLYAQKKSTE